MNREFVIESGSELGADYQAEADVVVIGSGAGGAVATHFLAEAGYRVICLEEGGHYTRRDFTGRQTAATRQLYRMDGMTLALGTPSVVTPMGCSIGGTTTINAGTSFETPGALLAKWRQEFGLTVDVDTLQPHYDAIEKIMPVAPAPRHLLGGNSEVVDQGVKALGWSGGPIPRNAPTCHGCCRCVLGCPEDAKLSMNISFVPAGIASGATYIQRARVAKVEHRSGKATAIRGDLMAADGSRRTGRFTIKARAVVLAAGAAFTPILLKRSRLHKGSRHVGAHLRLHPANRMVGLFDRPIEGWKGILQGYYVDEFASEGVKLEGVFVNPGLLAPALPFFGAQNWEIMKNYGNLAIFGAMAQDDSPGGVQGSVLGMPRMSYRLTQADADKIIKGCWAIGRIYFEAGARAVYTGIHGYGKIDSVDALDKLLHVKIPPAHLEVLSMHPHGTVPMAADAKLGAVDPAGKVWGTDNVYVADGSLFPGALGVNPQLSIMAFARHVASKAAEKLS